MVGTQATNLSNEKQMLVQLTAPEARTQADQLLAVPLETHSYHPGPVLEDQSGVKQYLPQRSQSPAFPQDNKETPGNSRVF